LGILYKRRKDFEPGFVFTVAAYLIYSLDTFWGKLARLGWNYPATKLSYLGERSKPRENARVGGKAAPSFRVSSRMPACLYVKEQQQLDGQI